MKARIAGLLFFIALIQGCFTLSEGRGSPISPPGAAYERHCSSPSPLEPLDAESSEVSSAAMLDLLETDIGLMHQGMNRLVRELLRRDKV